MDYKSVLNAAFYDAPIQIGRGIGCCRVYVVISDKAHVKGVAKAARAMNKVFQTKAHYGMSNALYIGYDNCDGLALARANAVAKVFNENKISCYVEYHGD